jgi:hypothetical protein
MEEMAYIVDNLIPINTLFSRSLPSRHVIEIAQFPFPFHEIPWDRAIAPKRALDRGPSMGQFGHNLCEFSGQPVHVMSILGLWGVWH